MSLSADSVTMATPSSWISWSELVMPGAQKGDGDRLEFGLAESGLLN